MASYKLTYFDCRGGGEIVRLTFAAAGQKFEDERLTFDDWPARKLSAPFKVLPTLTITKDGKDTVYCQSGAIAKYIAKKYGLFGSDPEESLFIEEVYDCVMDIFRDTYRAHFDPSEEKRKEGMKNFEEVGLPKFAAYFDLRSKSYGKNGFIIGPELTLADIITFYFMDNLTRVGYETVWEPYPSLMKHYQHIMEEDKIAAYLSERPDSPY